MAWALFLRLFLNYVLSRNEPLCSKPRCRKSPWGPSGDSVCLFSLIRR